MEQQDKDVRRPHSDFRNQFAHFTPMGWQLKEGFPRIIGAALSAVEYLMSCPRAAIHLDERDQARLQRTPANARASLGI